MVLIPELDCSYVDETLKGTNETAIVQMKFRLLKARLRRSEENTTGANSLTMANANKMSNVDAASILMDPLGFYQVKIPLPFHLISSSPCFYHTILQYYGFQASLLPFCNTLETQNFTQDPVEAGVVAQFGIEKGFESFLMAISEVDYDAIPRSVDDPVTDRSWMWQYCSEYGMFRF